MFAFFLVALVSAACSTINTSSRCGEDVTAPRVGKGDVEIDVVSSVGVEKDDVWSVVCTVMYLFFDSISAIMDM